jgi:hypothetical protein
MADTAPPPSDSAAVRAFAEPQLPAARVMPGPNVSHIRDGKVTEFWGATTDPEASIDFWS